MRENRSLLQNCPWTGLAHNSDDTLLMVTTSTSDSHDAFRPGLVQTIVDEIREN